MEVLAIIIGCLGVCGPIAVVVWLGIECDREIAACKRDLRRYREEDREWEQTQPRQQAGRDTIEAQNERLLRDMETNLRSLNAACPPEFDAWLRREIDNTEIN